MYRVQYFCSRQSPLWQGKGEYSTFDEALFWCQLIKPPAGRGRARILNPYGTVVYEI